MSEPADDARTQPVSPVSIGASQVGLLVGGRYRLDRKVGRGSSADVFAALDEVLGRAVAVKLFRFDTALGDDRRRIEAEMRLLASLHHPGLVAVYDAGTVNGATEGAPYLVMELVDGPTLSERLVAGPLAAPEAARLGADLASTLAHIHSVSVVHRDVKPANILLGGSASADGEHTAKLADFGIARIVDGTRLTNDGHTIGTPNYLSPEQALGTDVGPPTDVYALGLVLIQCLTGSVAYPGSGIEAALARLHRPPEIPQSFGTGWARLLTEMTAHDAPDRPTAAEAARYLTQLSHEPDPAATDGPDAPAVRTARPHAMGSLPRGRRGATAGRRGGRLAAVGAGVVGIALLLGLGVTLVDRGRDHSSSSPTPGMSGRPEPAVGQPQPTSSSPAPPAATSGGSAGSVPSGSARPVVVVAPSRAGSVPNSAPTGSPATGTTPTAAAPIQPTAATSASATATTSDPATSASATATASAPATSATSRAPSPTPTHPTAKPTKTHKRPKKH